MQISLKFIWTTMSTWHKNIWNNLCLRWPRELKTYLSLYMHLLNGGHWILLMDLGLTLLAPNTWRPMDNIRYWCLKQRAALHICVKDITRILPRIIITASGKTLMSYFHGYMQQYLSWTIDTFLMCIFRMSRNFPENFGYLPSRNSTCTPNTMSLSANGVIS